MKKQRCFQAETSLILLILLLNCTVPSDEHASYESTYAMAERLAELSSSLSIQNPFANSIRLAWLREQPIPQEPEKRFQYLSAYGEEALNAGEAIEKFHEIEELLKQHPDLFTEVHYWQTAEQSALAYLRLGEQVNCIDNPTSASCIVPIRSEGVH